MCWVSGSPYEIGRSHGNVLWISGSLWEMGRSHGKVCWVSGSPYEMGRAHGLLMQDKARKMADAVWDYMEKQIVSESCDSPSRF